MSSNIFKSIFYYFLYIHYIVPGVPQLFIENEVIFILIFIIVKKVICSHKSSILLIIIINILLEPTLKSK